MKLLEVVYLYILIFGTIVLMVLMSYLGPETRKLGHILGNDLHRAAEILHRITRPMFHIAWFIVIVKLGYFI